MKLQEIIKYMEQELHYIKTGNEIMDEKSFGFEYGIILTGDEAKYLLKFLRTRQAAPKDFKEKDKSK